MGAAAEPSWLALLHYRQDGAGWKSQADKPAFFLSRGARVSPDDELQVDAGGRQGLALAWAGFRHTLADPAAGYEANAEVTVLRPEVRFNGNGKARLERIDWLALQSTLPRSALFARSAWRLELASARKDFADRAHMVTSVGYSSGQAWALGDTVLAVMPGVGIDAGSKGSALASMAVLLGRLGARGSVLLDWHAEKMLLGSPAWRTAARARASLGLTRNLTLEAHVRRVLQSRPVTEAGLALTVHVRALTLTQ